MITEDVSIFKEIFSIVDSGIVNGYDEFNLEVVAGDGYIDTALEVEKDDRKFTNAETSINGSVLYGLVKRLIENSKNRGESWSAFVMSYRHGGQVKVNFKYVKD